MRERDETHDEELGAALREAVPAPPLEAVDWTALHGRIVTRATPLLAGRPNARPGVWQTLSGWAVGAIPLTAAAAAAVLFVLSTGLSRVAREPAATVVTVEEALADDLFAGATSLLTGATDDDVLDALLLYADGER